MNPARILKKLRLGYKISFLVAIVLFMLLVAIVAILNFSINNLAIETSQQRIKQEIAVIQGRLDEIEQEMLAAAKLLATTPGLAEAVANKRATSVKKVTETGAAQLGLDNVQVVDAKGDLITTLKESTSDPDKQQDLLSMTSLGIESTDIITKPGPMFCLVAITPLRDESGTLVGGLLVSREFNDDLLTEINLAREDIYLLLMQDAQVLASSLTHDQLITQQDLAIAIPDQDISEQVLAGNSLILTNFVKMDRIPHALAYTPFKIKGKNHAVIGILVDASELANLRRNLTKALTLVFIFLGIVTMALMVSLFRRGVTNPLRKLQAVTERMAYGDYEQRAEISTMDEIGQLANAFNTMADAVQAHQANLKQVLVTEQEQREHLQTTVARYVDYMAEIGRGNLSARLTLEDQFAPEDDPLITLGRNLNETVVSLQRMTLKVSEAANNLSSVATQILASTSQQVVGVNEQATAINQTSSTIDEVRAIAEQTSQRAQGVADLAQHTAEISHSGHQVVGDAVVGAQEVKSKVEVIASEILALSEQTQTIGEIIATVKQIADQSHLLALNAAVEAVRAGEAGRGFAVVAGEVRRLAEQSNTATEQIREILSDIQDGVNAAVMATEQGTKRAESGMQLAGQAGESIQQLAQSVTESTQAATQIVAAASQQLAGMEQISLAMQDINQVAAQNETGAKQAERAAEDLNTLAEQMRELVGQYRL